MNETPSTLYCANHPTTETGLRCNNCEKPICPKCAVLTPTGYRCRECVRNQQKIFDTALWFDYPLAAISALILSYIGSQIVTFIGFFTIFLAPIAGIIIAEVIRFVTRRRRSRTLFLVAAIATALGSIPPLLIILLGGLLGANNFWAILPLLWQGLYTFTVTTTVFYRLRGINIR